VARWSDDPRVEQVVICSVDKDLAQCVQGDHVVLRDRIRNKTYDEAGIVEKFGVPPASIPDYLALVGDSSDGYPGLPGWGAKSAAAVLARWHRIDEVPESALDWDLPLRNASRLAATLVGRRDEALLYRTLAVLRTDSPISRELDELEWRGVPREPFLALCEELGFERIRERIHRWEAPAA
jgi:5'-3' exonuclease